LVRIEDVYGPLQKVKKSIAKGEYYLTDLIEELIARDKRVSTVTTENDAEGLGVNNRAELARADGVLQNRICHHWMESGVTMISPKRSASTRARVGAGRRPASRVPHRRELAHRPGAEILPYSVIEDSDIGSGARVGLSPCAA
jgi:bifunctional UDP-N-acetylglucosamine pyrophosphorylase/glucosamine-1-phosphate N-acetyltransferase